MRTHVLTPPVNLLPKDRHEFNPLNFEIPLLSFINLTDVTVTQFGMCLKDHELIRQSVYRHRDLMQLYYLLAQQENDAAFFSIPDSQTLIIHGPRLDIFHWITESLPRLLIIRDKLETLTLLLPPNIKKTHFYDSLKPFEIKRIKFLPAGKNVKVEDLTLPDMKPYFSIFDEVLVNQIRELYVGWAQKLSRQPRSRSRLIYLPLEAGDFIFIENKAAIEEGLKKMGFRLLDPGRTSFKEMVKIINDADILVSSDNPQLAYMQFLKAGASVLELKFAAGNNVNLYANRYWHLASCLNLKYHYQFGNHTSYAPSNNLVRGFVFDVRRIWKTVAKMLWAIQHQ